MNQAIQLLKQIVSFALVYWKWILLVLAVLLIWHWIRKLRSRKVTVKVQHTIKLEEPTGDTRIIHTQGYTPTNNGDAGTRKVLQVAGVEFPFRWCPPGSFMQGSPAKEQNRVAHEIHHCVKLTHGFWMLETPVTQQMWKAIMGENPSYRQADTLPVETVDWKDALKFTLQFSSLSGTKCTLPTEAQWEYACRAGASTPFHFGYALNGTQANCDGTQPYGLGQRGPSLQKTTQVGIYPPNAWGICDMHGNVWEWCSDWYGEYPKQQATNPQGPPSGKFRVIRGGCWKSRATECRSAFRDHAMPEMKNPRMGFRVVMTEK